jgi:hypothetical protein
VAGEDLLARSRLSSGTLNDSRFGEIRRARPQLVEAETATWNLGDQRKAFTQQRVLARR